MLDVLGKLKSNAQYVASEFTPSKLLFGMTGQKNIFYSGVPNGSNNRLQNLPMRDMANFLDANNWSDPLFLRFKVLFNFNQKFGLLARTLKPDADYNASENYPDNSALGYLRRIGDTAREYLLVDLIKTLYKIQTEAQYLFTEVENLGEVYQANFQQMAGDGLRIKLKMRETIDMKVAHVITSYRKIVFDQKRKVQVIPDNLLRFSVNVWIYPMLCYQIASGDDQYNIIQRILPTAVEEMENGKVVVSGLPPLDSHNNIVFRFDEAQFDPYLSGEDFFQNFISTGDVPETVNSLALKIRWFDIDSQIISLFSSKEDIISDSWEVNMMGSFYMALADQFKATNADKTIELDPVTVLGRKRSNLLKGLSDSVQKYIKTLVGSTLDTLAARGLQMLDQDIRTSPKFYGNIYDDSTSYRDIANLARGIESGNFGNINGAFKALNGGKSLIRGKVGKFLGL